MMNRKDIPSHMQEARQAERQGLVAKAEAIYRGILAQHDDHDPAWHALGLLAYAAGNAGLAIQCIEQAIRVNGTAALYRRNLCEMYRRVGMIDKAIDTGLAACRLAPDDVDAHYNLGLAYTDAQEHARAINAYRAALALAPNHGLSWNNLGAALQQTNANRDAEQAYANAVAVDPKHAEALNNLGTLLAERGKIDAARQRFEQALAARPGFVEAHYNLSSLKTYRLDDPHLAALEQLQAQRERLDNRARVRHAFALGKALDDVGQYDRAFAAYEEGNRLQHRLLPYDEPRAEREVERILQVFDAAFFERHASLRTGDKDQRTPVFIVGMPRSGTTLLEQILCSHPAVHGAGELRELHQSIYDARLVAGGEPFANGFEDIDDNAIRCIGKDYLQRVWQLAPDSAFITDKMPANFLYLGVIHLALPHAKIIHAMRDPMDSCFSCYTRLFNDTMGFAYDQGTLGRYYARYMRLMEHWRTVLPPGTILDLPYEAMVADTRAQSRRVLEFIGLPWNEACLDFHRNDRLVKTASVAQVRKPIYKTSVARWKHFASHLKPLHELVKPWTTADYSALFDAISDANLPAAADAAHVDGILLYRQERFAEALVCYERALALRPAFPEALNSLGFLLQDLGQIHKARARFEQAVELAPQLAMARLNLAMAQLKLGDWEAGWENYEARWTGAAEAGVGGSLLPPCALPRWDGQGNAAGQRLLVITEQGFGDTFQFARYLPLLAKRFARVGFVCSAPTRRLIEWAFGENVVTFLRLPADTSAWDLQCPLLSLPRAFRTRPDSIPAAMPYLHAPAPVARHWGERLDALGARKLRVGLAWAGRKTHRYDSRRSLAFGQLEPLLRVTQVTWVSLQKWAPDDARPTVPAHVDWVDWTDELSDFADTAALVSNLDLVISIDSSMVHLAGALAKPVWMMNRFDGEWRWFHGRSDSPWYPTLRIFTQPAFGDWSSVLADVAGELADLSTPARPAAPALPARISTVPDDGRSVHASLDTYDLAAQLQGAGRADEAEPLLRQVLREVPGHAHALHLLAIGAWSSGRHAEAIDILRAAIAADASVAKFHSNLTEMLRQSGQVQDAIHHGETAVRLDPSLADAHCNLGIAYYDADELARAEACQLRALAIQPGMPQACNNLGSIARARRATAQAVQWYRKAIDAKPDYIDALSNLGAVLTEDNKAEEAETLLIQVLALHPNHAEALSNLGLLRLKQYRTAEAAALFERALLLTPHDATAHIGLARALREQQRPRQAEALLRQCLARHATRIDGWLELAALLAASGAADEAEAANLHALSLIEAQRMVDSPPATHNDVKVVP